MSTIKENLIDLFELEKMAPEKAVETINRLSNLVFQAVLVRALPLLSEKDLTEYEKLVDSQKEGDELFKFLNEKVEDFENMIKEEAENLHAELAGEFKSVEIDN